MTHSTKWPILVRGCNYSAKARVEVLDRLRIYTLSVELYFDSRLLFNLTLLRHSSYLDPTLGFLCSGSMRVNRRWFRPDLALFLCRREQLFVTLDRIVIFMCLKVRHQGAAPALLGFSARLNLQRFIQNVSFLMQSLRLAALLIDLTQAFLYFFAVQIRCCVARTHLFDLIKSFDALFQKNPLRLFIPYIPLNHLLDSQLLFCSVGFFTIA